MLINRLLECALYPSWVTQRVPSELESAGLTTQCLAGQSGSKQASLVSVHPTKLTSLGLNKWPQFVLSDCTVADCLVSVSVVPLHDMFKDSC
jgi:hypothetical protein